MICGLLFKEAKTSVWFSLAGTIQQNPATKPIAERLKESKTGFLWRTVQRSRTMQDIVKDLCMSPWEPWPRKIPDISFFFSCIYLCIWTFCLHVCLRITTRITRVQRGQKWALDSLGLQLQAVQLNALIRRCWDSNPGPLEDQPVLLPTEPFSSQ